MHVTCYICQVGALSKAKDILEWNMGLVLATATILFQRNISRCGLSGHMVVPYLNCILPLLHKRQRFKSQLHSVSITYRLLQYQGKGKSAQNLLLQLSKVVVHKRRDRYYSFTWSDESCFSLNPCPF